MTQIHSIEDDDDDEDLMVSGLKKPGESGVPGTT